MNRATNHHEHATIYEAIRASWSADTSATPEQWSAANPAKGQCDVSSFVAWEHLGGALVLGQVFVNGDQTEHHYWNRIAGVDLDLTHEQFDGSEDIREVALVTSEEIEAKRDTMRPELAARLALLRQRVSRRLAADYG